MKKVLKLGHVALDRLEYRPGNYARDEYLPPLDDLVVFWIEEQSHTGINFAFLNDACSSVFEHNHVVLHCYPEAKKGFLRDGKGCLELMLGSNRPKMLCTTAEYVRIEVAVAKYCGKEW